MVGTGRFELPTPRTPSECSTRLSHVPTRKEPTALQPQRMGFYPISLHQAERIEVVKRETAGRRRYVLRFDFLEEGFVARRRGASSKIANWIFFSTGSIRSTSTRILCPRL